jgi:hypothetical protein
VAIQTGVIDNHLAATVIANMEVSAKGGGSTNTDVVERLELAKGQHVSPPIQKLLFMLTKDIGDFWPMSVHRF